MSTKHTIPFVNVVRKDFSDGHIAEKCSCAPLCQTKLLPNKTCFVFKIRKKYQFEWLVIKITSAISLNKIVNRSCIQYTLHYKLKMTNCENKYNKSLLCVLFFWNSFFMKSKIEDQKAQTCRDGYLGCISDLYSLL